MFLYGMHDHLYEPLTHIEIIFYMVYGSRSILKYIFEVEEVKTMSYVSTSVIRYTHNIFEFMHCMIAHISL